MSLKKLNCFINYIFNSKRPVCKYANHNYKSRKIKKLHKQKNAPEDVYMFQIFFHIYFDPENA